MKRKLRLKEITKEIKCLKMGSRLGDPYILLYADGISATNTLPRQTYHYYLLSLFLSVKIDSNS